MALDPDWLWAAVAALSWAALDAVRKSLARDVPSVVAVIWLSLGPAALFATLAASEGASVPDAFDYWLAATGTVALNALAYVSFMEALARSPLSLTIPLLSLSPVLTVGAALLTVGELPSPVQGLGIGLVVVGGLELQRPEEGGFRQIGREPGAKFMLATAILWSMAAALDKQALAYAPVSFHAVVQTGGVGLVLVLLLLFRGRVRELSTIARGWRPFLLALGLTAVAVGSQLTAYRALEVSLVEALKRATGVTVALAVGRLWFGETLGPRKALMALAIAVGAVLVLTG
jgi:drug/metabolite transporter (DMT)-like permease